MLGKAAGPEQVSPHYESLSRSRRAVIFLFFYVGTIMSVANLGGWEQNEWLKGLLFQSKFIITFFIGYVEIKHFHWIPGPKFTAFYDQFSRYELSQLVNQWQDLSEESQNKWFQNTKKQLDYMRIHNEYKFVKKRSLMNYLTNSR